MLSLNQLSVKQDAGSYETFQTMSGLLVALMLKADQTLLKCDKNCQFPQIIPKCATRIVNYFKLSQGRAVILAVPEIVLKRV